MYDVIIIGGGPAGYHAALKLDDAGKSVLLIEEKHLGGTCLHEGCIPTKSILNEVKIGNTDENSIYKKRNQDVQKLFLGLQYRFNKSGVKVINGHGVILGKRENIFCVCAAEEVFEADKVIIATGSTYIDSEIEGFDDAFKRGMAVYSRQFLNFASELPKNISIIGAGVIGIEIASYLCALGKEVTVFEKSGVLLEKMLDEDVRSIVMDILNKQGCKLYFDCDVVDISDDTIIYRRNGEFDECETDYIIFVAGRKSNINDIGLENVGIQTCNGSILVDNSYQTSENGVFACGDVIGGSMLAHAAFYEADVVVDTILERNNFGGKVIPSVIYGISEIASVGLNENDCVKNDIEYFVKKQSMNYSSMYFIENQNDFGICKMIFDKEETLIGAQIVGKHASELIFSLAEMINAKEKMYQIGEKVYPHPSYVEIIREVIAT